MFVFCGNVDNLFSYYVVQWCIILDTQNVCILRNVDNLFANYIVQWCIILDTQNVCILRNVDNLFAYYVAQVCIIRTREVCNYIAANGLRSKTVYSHVFH